MEKINTFLNQNVANLAIGLATVGILSHLFNWVYGPSQFGGLFLIIVIQEPSVVFLQMDIFNVQVSLLSILFLLMLIIGGLHFKKSNGQDARLLKFCFGILGVYSLLCLTFTPVDYLTDIEFAMKDNNGVNNERNLFYYLSYWIVQIPLAYIGIYLTKWLTKKSKLDIIKVEDENGINYTCDDVPTVTRIGHLIFDFLICMFILWPFFNYLVRYLNLKFNGEYFFVPILEDPFILIVLIGFVSLIYYIIFEGIYRSTPVKFLTGTRVILSSDYTSPTNGIIFLRSICRRTPFDALSFLVNKKGIHDAFSGTSVAYEKRVGYVNFKQIIWGLVLIGVYGVLFLLKML